MRNKFVYLFVLSLIYIFCYSQPKNNIEKDISKNVSKDSGKVLKNQIMELEKTISLLDTMTKSIIIFLTQSIDSNKKCIDDTRLRESLRSAEKTINFENSFIQIFGVIYAIIAIIAGFLYFFSFRPLVKKSEIALKQARVATGKLEKKSMI